MKYLLDRIHPSALFLTLSLTHLCKCWQWCQGPQFCLPWDCNLCRSSGAIQGHGTCKMRVSLLQSVSWPLPPTPMHSSSYLWAILLPITGERCAYPVNILLLYSLQRALTLPMAHDIFLWLPGTYLWVKQPEANVILLLLSVVFQGLHKWLASQLLLSSRESAGRFYMERAFSQQRDPITLRNMIPWVYSLRSLC